MSNNFVLAGYARSIRGSIFYKCIFIHLSVETYRQKENRKETQRKYLTNK